MSFIFWIKEGQPGREEVDLMHVIETAVWELKTLMGLWFLIIKNFFKIYLKNKDLFPKGLSLSYKETSKPFSI